MGFIIKRSIDTSNFASCLLVVVLVKPVINEQLRFGEGFTQLYVTETDRFPAVDDFIKNYIIQSKPLIIRNGASISPAFSRWSDDYFLSFNASKHYKIACETVKKETRKDHYEAMNLKDFINVYNETELYMVDSVPKFLQKDILIPCSLQSESIQFTDTIMWYSSGGTKSVVHTDNVDNLNCLYRGKKHFIMVDKKNSHNVDLDHPQGAYSSIDVDNVDFDKFPGLLQAEYYNVTVNAGDCLYIPYLWIHQVRSYGNNLAVNIWFDHFEAIKVNESSLLSSTCNVTLNLENVKFFKNNPQSKDMVKDQIFSLMGIHDSVSHEVFVKSILAIENLPDPILQRDAAEIFHSLFKSMDSDQNGFVSKLEVANFNQWDWYVEEINKIQKKLELLDSQEDQEFDNDFEPHTFQSIEHTENLADNTAELQDDGRKYEL